MIPSINECFALMNKYDMLDNIKNHSIMVAKIAKLLGICLIKTGENICLEKVVSGALLHDIAKTECIGSKKDHSKIGMEICLNEGLDEIADIVGEHIVLNNFSLTGQLFEKELVFYSDKRVLHDSIVSIDERLKDLIIRYCNGNDFLEQLIISNFKICKNVEEKLFKNLDFFPQDLFKIIKQKIINIE